MKQPANESAPIVQLGTIEALAEIHRQAEARLREAMMPARLQPLSYSHRNGMAASKAVIEEIRSF